jgi:hypothetical protein
MRLTLSIVKKLAAFHVAPAKILADIAVLKNTTCRLKATKFAAAMAFLFMHGWSYSPNQPPQQPRHLYSSMVMLETLA